VTGPAERRAKDERKGKQEGSYGQRPSETIRTQIDLSTNSAHEERRQRPDRRGSDANETTDTRAMDNEIASRDLITRERIGP
jgi:hypothetical protein